MLLIMECYQMSSLRGKSVLCTLYTYATYIVSVEHCNQWSIFKNNHDLDTCTSCIHILI